MQRRTLKIRRIKSRNPRKRTMTNFAAVGAEGYLRRLLVGAIAAATAASTALAQSPLDSVPIKALYEKAKAEGTVLMWGTNVREVDWIPKAFTVRFPGIDVKVVGDNNITTTAI